VNEKDNAAADDADGASRDALFVGSVAKAMQVLEAFAGAQQLGLSEVAERAGMPKSAAQRFIHTWWKLGYLQKMPGRRLALTHKLLERSYDFLLANPLIARVTPHLVDARDRCRQNVNFSILDGTDIVYLVRVPSHRQQLSPMLPGRRQPAFCSSGGRAMLSLLPDEDVRHILRNSDLKPFNAFTQTSVNELMREIRLARKTGFAIVEQQIMVGEIAVASAVADPAGNAIGAVHIAGFIDEFPRARVIDTLAKEAVATARIIASHQV
jgi:IclR family pca regulon transcriptional regulator